MNIANIPTVFLKSVVKNGKIVVPIVGAGILALGIVEIVNEVRK
ncbi:MAG: hypothetical protein PHQ97_15165 [Desulfobacterales bacterium]|nr:hypothetical protein [Desulfobacterales bacterium]